jgi:hypothetical protein
MSRHYVYVSTTKVDMIVSQISMQTQKKVLAEIGFNLGVLKGKIQTDRASLSDPFQRLELAEKVVRADHTVRAIGSSANWIADSIPMASLRLAEERGLMFYVADMENHVFAIGGSAGHVIGSASAGVRASGISHAPRLLDDLQKIVASNDPQTANASRKHFRHALHVGVSKSGKVLPWTKLLDEASALAADNPKQKLQFLARVLHSETWPLTGKRYTLATPLYVALADG